MLVTDHRYDVPKNPFTVSTDDFFKRGFIPTLGTMNQLPFGVHEGEIDSV